MQGNRAGNNFPCHIESTVGSGVHAPFHQSHGKTLDFDTGDTAGVDAASRVIVAGRVGGKDRTVRVSCDQDAAVFPGPAVQPGFTFVFYMIVFGGAGGIKNTQVFQRIPDIPNQKPGEGPERGIEQAGLMAVGQIERDAGHTVRRRAGGQDDSFMKAERRKKRLQPLLSFYDIMVAVEQIQAVLLIKLMKEPEHVAVDIHDIFHVSVFPELITVPQFNIGKTLSVIVLQGGEIQMLVFQKVIGGIADAPVTVAHKDIAGAV